MNNLSIGYTGQRRSTLTGSYLLGNGYRGFNPVLRRFQAWDTFSPFGQGGANGYGYCAGDPVNQCDISGHAINSDIFTGAIGILVGLLSLLFLPFTGGTSIAIASSAIASTLGVISSSARLASGLVANEGAAYMLKKIGLGFGVASAVAGFGGIVAGLAEGQLTKITRGFRETYKVTIGRSAKKASNLMIPNGRRLPGIAYDDPVQRFRGPVNITVDGRNVQISYAAPNVTLIPNYKYTQLLGPFLLKTERTLTNVKGFTSFFARKPLLTNIYTLVGSGFNVASSSVIYSNATPPPSSTPAEESMAVRQSVF
ncbi:RHS repeat-associated core domain-containing protein [Budvicia diplopodorum]|uniref:RHS repeat-associated core domain-containing protein n=1 Tax=Budvicia diplopodorum TaxID=1119056 RepID=UPI0013575033|nr:RHS repeat-associated core domain-containing protein [Budvicia diplopodorum]